MTERKDDSFWDLEKYIKKSNDSKLTPKKSYKQGSTEAVEISDSRPVPSPISVQASIPLSRTAPSLDDGKISREESSEITRIIPPHRDPKSIVKHVIFEYTPKNPLIKSVKIYSDKPDDKVFIESNLFIRERAALLRREAREQEYVPFYSYSPRYSQLSGSQLRYYLWWRENARRGAYLKADEAYIMLYAYELAATGDGEDKSEALSALCSLISAYPDRELNVILKSTIRDLICDFCLMHGLDFPAKELKGVRNMLSTAPFPEFFLDLSPEHRAESIAIAGPSLSIYDYKRSKFYDENTAKIFKESIRGALMAVANHEKAFAAMTSFTDGVYGSVTVERHPFGRMVNIVNKNIKFEITYYQISNIKIAVTDAIRCAEKRLREHLGIKNKLHISSVNPWIKEAVDRYFDENYPAIPTVDRRRKEAREQEAHEYDKLYDLPKTEISPERALMIEQESWDTTKILTEAFADEVNEQTVAAQSELTVQKPAEQKPAEQKPFEAEAQIFTTSGEPTSEGDVTSQLKESLGTKADFVRLCKDKTLAEQRAFARSVGISVDELADEINETAVNIFGDIILENDGEAYRIIEDYLFLF